MEDPSFVDHVTRFVFLLHRFSVSTVMPKGQKVRCTFRARPAFPARPHETLFKEWDRNPSIDLVGGIPTPLKNHGVRQLGL